MYQLEEISIEVTNACSLACIHCSSGSSPVRMPNELTLAEHLSLLEQARELGATVFSISGGSPLDYIPEDARITGLVDLVSHAINVGFERLLVYTTGHSEYGPFIWNYPWLDDLRGLEQLTWIFSLHSHDSTTNDYIMNRAGAYAEITSSIITLQRCYETVEIHMVPMKPNFRDIPKVRQLCGDLGVSKMSCLRFVPQTRGKDNVHDLGMSKAEFAEMQFLLHIEMELNDTSLCEMRLGCPIDFRHSVGLLDTKRKPCHAGDDLILIRPTGDVHPCAAWKSLPADANVRNASLKDIWAESEVFNAVRTFKYGTDTDPDYSYSDAGYKLLDGTCSLCSMINSCLTGCPAQRLHALGADSIEALYTPTSDPLCPRGD